MLHCPTMTGGNPQGLARAERELGLQSWAVVFRSTYFDYETDEVLFDSAGSRLVAELKRWKLLWRALRDYDVIHFNFGRSILPPALGAPVRSERSYRNWIHFSYYLYSHLLNMNDISLLHWAGKGIVVTFQGDDARQGEYLANFEISPINEVDANYYTSEDDQIKRRIIAKFAHYADRIFYLNPDLAYVLPSSATFMPYGHIDLRAWQPVPGSQSPGRKPVLLHAPSHRGVKGTRYVLNAVERLKAEGLAFEFVLVEGLSHAEARCLYERADLLIDQLLLGWYGGLAVELMALGKPVICYIREDDLTHIPSQMRAQLPIINATPATLYDVLKEWLTTRRHQLVQLGQKSRAYVERWHDPLKIAAKLKKEYEVILAEKGQRNL